MKKRNVCEYEAKIVQITKAGKPNAEISAHLETCADCRETVKIATLFQTNLIAQSMPKTMPAAGLVWWKSEIRTKRRRAERVASPIFFVQIAAAVVVAATLLWLLLNPQFSFFDAAFNRILASLEQIIVHLVAGVIGFTLVCATLVLFLRRFLLEK